MVMESSHGMMLKNMKELGKTTRWMERVFSPVEMGVDMKASTKITNETDLEYNLPRERSMKVNGRVEICMEKVQYPK